MAAVTICNDFGAQINLVKKKTQWLFLWSQQSDSKFIWKNEEVVTEELSENSH